jgi:hypothetical protein
MEAFPTAWLALQVVVPTVAASIPGPSVGEECWNTALGSRVEAMVTSMHLEVVAATSKSAWLQV